MEDTIVMIFYKSSSFMLMRTFCIFLLVEFILYIYILCLFSNSYKYYKCKSSLWNYDTKISVGHDYYNKPFIQFKILS